jgi:steroid delta-isomerase-like uncharacterized protein
MHGLKDPMMSEDNKQLVRRFYDMVWSQGRIDSASEFLADGLIDHDAIAFPGRLPGAQGLVQVVAMIRAALPDLTRTVDDQICESDRVVTRFTDRGTHHGDLLGIPATGKEVRMAGINIELIREGKIAELWHIEDLLGLLGQLGAVPVATSQPQPDDVGMLSH